MKAFTHTRPALRVRAVLPCIVLSRDESNKLAVGDGYGDIWGRAEKLAGEIGAEGKRDVTLYSHAGEVLRVYELDNEGRAN